MIYYTYTCYYNSTTIYYHVIIIIRKRKKGQRRKKMKRKRSRRRRKRRRNWGRREERSEIKDEGRRMSRISEGQVKEKTRYIHVLHHLCLAKAVILSVITSSGSFPSVSQLQGNENSKLYTRNYKQTNKCKQPKKAGN